MHSISVAADSSRYILQVYVGALSLHYEALSVEASKQTTADEIVSCIIERLDLLGNNYELVEVAGEYKERRLCPEEKPVSVMLLWPINSDSDFHKFYLRECQSDISWLDSYGLDSQIFRDFIPFLLQPENREYPDLCQLPDLNESTLLENLKQRFEAGYIYTYVGSILVALNPFKFYPIYNPKYVRLYQNQRIGPILPPHIFAIADNAYYSMLKDKRNQCIVISGESGSGKTESTNFLLHHLTALSQKGSHGFGVEQIILSAGPVLEAFGNAKTAHNNNSSRFGKFIQVNYRENGMVQGAVVQKYLLEKSRIVSQGPYERNYHVFYYILSGVTDTERNFLHLFPADKYNYLNSKNLILENCNEKYEFFRLKQSMEMVGFTQEKQRRLFSVLSAVLLLGNVDFFPKKTTYHHDESVQVKNSDIVALISELLKVKQDTLLAALTSKRVKASGETLIMQYKLAEAIAARDALAKCLYGALFDWIVLQVNHALLNKDQTNHTGNSIGVLDIFGFEDFGPENSFEQLCINYANEHLQYYFNLHVFKYEQNEYKRENIKWNDIEFMDNSGCLHLFESKPTGLLCILDDLCNFPGATNEILLQKFNSVHRDNPFYEKPQRKENAFNIKHYAGMVKYHVTEMREKNLDLMRQDIVSVLKNSNMSFVRELVGADPVAVFRWAILRAFFRSFFAFRNAGCKHRRKRTDCAFRKYSRKNNSCLKSEFTLRKNKAFGPRDGSKKGLKNLQTVKMMTAGTNINFNQTGIKTRKQPFTVTAQFQNSLAALMDTLNQANPFFIRCIKSNSQKIPNKFDENTVVRQLRYTGMLETVRIRRAGYNVRLTYDEFIQIYRILLPNGLVSSQMDVKEFLSNMDLNKQHYQLGATKIYMRESQKIRLDIKLHSNIIDSIILIQRWFRAIFLRKKFLTYKKAAITIQSHWRTFLAQNFLRGHRRRVAACLVIQSNWKMYKQKFWYTKLKLSTIIFQAHVRGYLLRQKLGHSSKNKISLKDSQNFFSNERSAQTHSDDNFAKINRNNCYAVDFASVIKRKDKTILLSRRLPFLDREERARSRNCAKGVYTAETLNVWNLDERTKIDKNDTKTEEIDNFSGIRTNQMGKKNFTEFPAEKEVDSSVEKVRATSVLGPNNKMQNMLCSHMNNKIKNRNDIVKFNNDLVPTSLQQAYDHTVDNMCSNHSDSSANKISLLDMNRGNDMYQSSTQVNIGGHRFRKAARIGKAEKCSSCQESDAFVNEGYRCLDCKVLVHTKCIQNGGIKSLTCRNKQSKGERKSTDKHTSHSKYRGVIREYTDSTDRIISDAKELNLMQDFITHKICKINSNEGDKSSEVDRVFKQALRAFKDNLVTQYSVAHKQNSDSLNIKYRDLIDNFEQVMETCCGKQNDFPLTMGVNAFRGFMNEFMNSRESDKPKAKRKKEKKHRKVDDLNDFKGHTFQLTIINIPTACETCQIFLLWPIERGLVCQNCRLTCHKKCYQKAMFCNKATIYRSKTNSENNIQATKLFGVPLSNLCLADGVNIPISIEQLITKIEMLALYTEGIYRKSGVNSKIRELKEKMSEITASTEIDYESYNVHVLTNVLKSFLREMPEPLLTFDRYDDFLRASDLPDNNLRVQTLLSLIKKLPIAHQCLLERIIFHLALVAQREKHNRMSASSLSIVFAPCVLRTNRLVPAQDSLNDICRQTRCLETLIIQKMANVKSTLADIDSLDTAAHTASTRLSNLRSSKIFTSEELSTRPSQIESEAEELILEDHIQEIRKEKALLTSTLPNLVRTTSEDDLLSTDMDGDVGCLDDFSSVREEGLSIPGDQNSKGKQAFDEVSSTRVEKFHETNLVKKKIINCDQIVGRMPNVRCQNVFDSSSHRSSRGKYLLPNSTLNKFDELSNQQSTNALSIRYSLTTHNCASNFPIQSRRNTNFNTATSQQKEATTYPLTASTIYTKELVLKCKENDVTIGKLVNEEQIEDVNRLEDEPIMILGDHLKMDAYMRGKDSNCNEATSNMALSLISSLTPATVINLCSAENFALTTHNELIGTNSVDLNPATSLSDDSGVPLTTNSSISSGDSYRLGMCRFEMELVESDGEVSQLDSLDNCSEGGMSAENFNTLKKGPLAPIEPPPEFQDSPHTTLGRCVPKNILNNLTRWSSSHSLFEKTNDSESDEGKLNKGDNAMMSRSTMQSNIKEQLYSSDIILNTHIDNIYDEPSDIVSFGRNIRIDSDSKPTAAPAKTYCPHYKDHTRYFRAIPSEHDGNLTCMSIHKMNGLSEIHDYDMYYDFKRNFFSANQFDSTIQMKVVCSPLNHHYHTGGSSFNRPNSRNSLNSRLSSSHNSLNVPSSNKPDDSIFITQAMSHDALLTREISDFYNVPIDSDIYAFPIDMIQADQEKTDDLNKTKENDSKPDKSIRQKCFRSNKRRKRSSNNLLNNNCTDEHLFGIDRKLNKPKHSYKAVALALAWDGSGNKQTVMSNGQIEPLEMTIDGVKNFYHTYYSGPKEPESVRKAIVGGSSAMGSPTKLTDIFPMKVKCADEMVLTLTEKEKFTKNQSPVVPMKVNNTMDIKNIKVVDKNDNLNNNTADSNHLHNSINHQEQQSNHRVQQNNSNNKLTLQSEKKSQFTLNLKQKFCSIFRFRKGQSRCQGNSTHSADYISGRDRKTNHIQYVDNKCKKFQSRALPPLPNKPCTETMSFELDGKVNKKQDLRAFHFTSSIEKVKDYGWYWGPLSSEAAEKVLSNEPDGSFIVRDSSDHHYIFSLSFKLNNCVRHVRIEQDQGTFSFGSYAKFKSQTITEFIEKAVEHSRSGRYLFFLHRRPEHGPMRVQLTNPVSRFKHIQSLQHMCRFIILKAVIRKDLIQTLPLPRRLLDYLSYKHCYSEQVESDGSQSQMSEDGQV